MLFCGIGCAVSKLPQSGKIRNMNDQGFDDDEDEEDNVAVGKISYWHLTVHVHGKAINVSCGDATQRVKWLAHVGIGLRRLTS